MKRSMYIGILIVILMIIVICVFAFVGNNKKENNAVNNEEKLNEETIIQNEQINEQINEQVNEVAENELVNETTSEVITNEPENTLSSSETFEESPKTGEEKAIDIAKKDWKDDKNVNFTIQGMDENGNYIVVVSDSETVALAFYTINVTDKTFTKREVN